MKKIITLIFLASMLSCQSQNINPMEPIINNKFETFHEIQSKLNFNKNEDAIRDFLPNGNYIEILTFSGEIQYTEAFNNTYYSITKLYFSNYNIKIKGISFNNDFPIGIWYEFDEQGKLIKETNYDEPYKFTFEDVLQFCEKENIKVDKGPILQSTGYHTLIMRYIDDDSNKPCWEIKYLKKYNRIEAIVLDGTTGEILSRREQEYINN